MWLYDRAALKGLCFQERREASRSWGKKKEVLFYIPSKTKSFCKTGFQC